MEKAREFQKNIYFCFIDYAKDFNCEAEVDIFLEFRCFLYDPTNVGSLISGSSAFSKSSLYIWKFLVHVLLEPSLKDFNITLLAQMVKNPPAMWETWVWSLGLEDPLEKGLATHSSILGLPWWLSG